MTVDIEERLSISDCTGLCMYVSVYQAKRWREIGWERRREGGELFLGTKLQLNS